MPRAQPGSALLSPTSYHPSALGVWLGLQLVTLLLAVMQIPLADQFPRPVERMALAEMLCVQVVMAALLSPILCQSMTSTVLACVTSWPLLALGGMLAAAPATQVMLASAFVTTWMVAIAAWMTMAGGLRTQLIISASATALALIGPLLQYLSAEFAGAEAMGRSAALVGISPVSGGLGLLDGGEGSVLPWLSVGITALIASVVWITRMFASRRSQTKLRKDAGIVPAE